MTVALIRPRSAKASPGSPGARAASSTASRTATVARSATWASTTTATPTNSMPSRSAPPSVAPSAPPTATGSTNGPTSGVLAGRDQDGLTGPQAGDVRNALRGLLACGHAQLMDLAPAERAKCSEQLGLASRTAPKIDAIPAEKRAYYDAVAAAYAKANAPPGNAPRWLAGKPTAGLLADRGGLTIPLVGCEMKFGVPRGYKTYHDVPPHALKLAKLGSLSCFVPPPSGRGFEESGVETPASLRERTDDAAHMKALDAPKP